MLPALISWNTMYHYPFVFTTEASIDLSDDNELMQKMVEASYFKVFIGIETPDGNSLKACNKTQNHKRNLQDCVHTIQQRGLEVSAGFIVDFDNDPPNIFQQQIDFIQRRGIINSEEFNRSRTKPYNAS